ncbi:hypothetical protein V6N13_068614 [Hibiscus sabdariffa]
MRGLTKLKYLDIKEMLIEELPYSIDHLENLSYLDVSGTDIQCLHDRICSLYKLQILKLSNCPHSICLPTNMKNLTKLKHLDTKGTHIMHMPLKFGNLKCLQLLIDFVVGINSESSISEIKDLFLLRTLSILRLQNVLDEKLEVLDIKNFIELVILKSTKVKSIDVEFYDDGVVSFKSLKTLQFEDMENWEAWLPFKVGEGFLSLVKLYVSMSENGWDLPMPHTVELIIEAFDKILMTWSNKSIMSSPEIAVKISTT